MYYSSLSLAWSPLAPNCALSLSLTLSPPPPFPFRRLCLWRKEMMCAVFSSSNMLACELFQLYPTAVKPLRPFFAQFLLILTGWLVSTLNLWHAAQFYKRMEFTLTQCARKFWISEWIHKRFLFKKNKWSWYKHAASFSTWYSNVPVKL